MAHSHVRTRHRHTRGARVPSVLALAALAASIAAAFQAPDASSPPPPSGASDPERARALVHAGRYAEADAVATSALRTLEPCAPERVELLALAGEARRRGNARFAPETLASARAAVELAADLHGLGDARAVEPFLQLGLLACVRREWLDARAALERARDLARTSSAGADPREAQALVFLAYVAAAGEKDEERAARDLASARAVQERTLPREHADLAWALEIEAAVARVGGDPERATSLRREALAMRRRVQPADHPLVVNAIVNGADDAKGLGRLGEARRGYEEALALLARSTETSRARMQAWASLGEVTAALGDVPTARAARERALAEAKELGESELDAAYEQGVADMALAEHDVGSARAHYRAAIAAHERAVAKDPCGHARAVAGLASIECAETAGDAAELDRLRARLAGLARACGDPDLDLVLRSIDAWRAAGRGDLAAAEELLVADPRALADPEMLVDAARVALLRGELAGALERGLASARAAREAWERAAPCHDELGRIALGRWAGLEQASSAALCAAARIGDASAAERTWNALLETRGRVRRECAERTRLLRDARDPEVRGAVERLAAARERLAATYVRLAREGGGAADDPRVAAARADREHAERQLAELVPLAARAVAIDVAALARALREDEALVSYVRATAPDSRDARDARDAHPLRWSGAYFACVLRAGSTPRVLALGDDRAIDGAAAAMRDAMDGTRGDGAARELRRLAWDPLASAIAGARRVHVVPDGALSQVPFDALVLDDGRYLAEGGPLVALHDGEEELLEAPSLAAPSAARGILLVGDPSFADGWARLPESAAEVAALRSTWERGRRADEPAEVLVGAGATERAVRERAAGKRVVHLATHGWFDAGGARSVEIAARGRPVVAAAATRAEPLAADAEETLAPSLRSGIVLARGDERSGDDGMLTTEEALALDLDGVEWVVLSACETALGELRRGESALGLRRALRNAGAAVVVGSVVPVDDRAARAWTEALYRARWIDGLDTVEAARAASLAVLADLRRAGAPTAPARWAGFVAVGADRAHASDERATNGRGAPPRRDDVLPPRTIGDRR